jgi:RimJ/RimL family protein N-acetyltransferase
VPGELTFPLETERLLLRPFRSDDFDAVYAFESLPEVARYLYWEPRSPEEVRAGLERKIASVTLECDGDVLDLAVELRSSGEVVGSCMLFWRDKAHQQGEVGFTFNPAHHGNGYATEAARRMVQLGFEHLRLHRVIGRLEARNTASARVLERCGMRREAHLVENEWVKDEWQSELVYAILDREWAEQNAG